MPTPLMRHFKKILVEPPGGEGCATPSRRSHRLSLTMKHKKRSAQARSSLARGSQFLVWWLKLPDYIWAEFCDRCGRPGRARLWVPDGIKVEKMDAAESDPRFEQYMDCGGIVIRAKDAPSCALWGGRFTDMALNPLDFANAKAEPRGE